MPECQMPDCPNRAVVDQLTEALRLALSGIPDPMHPGIPVQFVDRLVAAQIVISDALGEDDPGNVPMARETLSVLSRVGGGQADEPVKEGT